MSRSIEAGSSSGTLLGEPAHVSRLDASAIPLILLLGAFSGIGPLAIDLYLPSFPTIARQFGTTVASIERTLAVYFLGLAIGQLFYGPAADRFGRKGPLYVGLALFLVASIGCALAVGVRSLLLLRFVQALGGSAQMVVSRAIVRDYFHERDAAGVFSYLMLVMGVAPILAPLLGGWIVLNWGWRANFWILAGFSLLCIIATALLLRESLPPERRRRHNLAGTLGVYASLLRHRTFMAYTMSASLASAGLFAYVSGSSFVFIELFQIRPDRFGLVFGTNAAGLILASQVNGFLVHRLNPRRMVRVALIVATIAGMALFATTATGAGGLVGVLVPLFAFICSLGFIFPTTTALALAPHGHNAGNASAVLGCAQFLVSGLGGFLVSTIHDGSARPMGLVIACAATGALLVNVLFTRDEGEAVDEASPEHLEAEM